jgi:hypothetical protein
MVVEITSAPAFVSVSANSLVIQPIQFSEVGAATVLLRLVDASGLFSSYSMKVTVTNSAPTLTS